MSLAAGGASLAACLPCTVGVFCAPGSTLASAVICPQGWVCTATGTYQCPSGTYNGATGGSLPSACTNCAAGIWCPLGSTNGSVPCLSGWSCPGSGAANAICGPGY